MESMLLMGIRVCGMTLKGILYIYISSETIHAISVYSLLYTNVYTLLYRLTKSKRYEEEDSDEDKAEEE